MKKYSVYKTLVVGLGSTGTAIINALAERIGWEIGSASRAPWVRFLALETNPAQAHNLDPDDFRPLTLSATEYSQLVNNPEAYDDSIAMTRWSDPETLKKLPSAAVSAGAGHIRMVGRLALLYPNNFNMVRSALDHRMASLRNLTTGEISQALNRDQSKLQSFDVSVADPDAIRVFIVGTLSGGTCSGTAGDMGILVRALTQQLDERIVGIFTLPHPSHNNSVANARGLAEEHKANAYHALIELNQYQNTDDPLRFVGIRYPGFPQSQSILSESTLPYDLIYLIRARNNTQEDQESLIHAASDRIFLNIFVPGSDPMRAVVDGGIVPPKNGLTFNFSTFGIANIEYPVRRILEASKCRVVSEALAEWKDRKNVTLDFPTIIEQELKLSPQNLLEDLLSDDSGGSVREEISKLRSQVSSAALSNPEAGETALREWRSAFERPGEGLRGKVTRTVLENRRQVIQKVMDRLFGQINKGLSDFYYGPAPLEAVVDEARRQLGEIRQWSPKTVRAADLDSIIQRLRAIRNNSLLGAFLLKRQAVDSLAVRLKKALADEERARLEHKLYELLQDGPNGPVADPGIITELEVQIGLVQSRFGHLRQRLDSYQVAMSNRYKLLDSKRGADINGLSLYRPGPVGTLDEEMGRVMDGKSLADLYRKMIAGWSGLDRALIPSGGQDWLRESPNQGEPPLGREWTQKIEEIALAAFSSLREGGKSLEDRVRAMSSPSFDPEKEIRGATEKAGILISMDEVLGQHSPDKLVMPRKLLFARESGDTFERAMQVWRNTTPNAQFVPVDDGYRMVMLEEKHKFSLRAALEIMNILGGAKASAVPTYFTRRRMDIDWTPISENERRSLVDAQRRLNMALIHGVVQIKGGFLVLPWPEQLGVKENQRFLPNVIARAARMIAFSKSDAKNLPLADASTVLKGRVDQAIEEIIADRGHVGYVQFLKESLSGGSFTALKDWESAEAVRVFMQWHQEHPEVMKAVLDVFPPDPIMLQRLWKNQGDSKPRGGLFEQPGYYCQVCGGPLGPDLEHAAANAFRCDYYPDDDDHPFGEPYSVFRGLL